MDRFPLFFALVIGFIVFAMGYAVYDEATAEHFSLRKDRWVCTASHQESTTTYTQVGAVPVPITSWHTVCDQWTAR